ncbi:2-vinyl bacteriochlorophyllide hydratase [Parasphingorhabdus cellanae]|uniref:2-vinyl bacteriochlorophyllide hydratase n=1 Tax=Parasphingorhabdus cellanae TaxID=2806553 RepID=A0ABX7TAJ5_9SPHN|nr:2-vinyl bacteriochlorophyllide hydratase [Parasphingorhabdus cellanae]
MSRHNHSGEDHRKKAGSPASDTRYALYTEAQRKRRDESTWTLVQGILAPVQFLIFIISLTLVIRFLSSGVGESIAEYSILLKTLALYLIMITGSIWEKVVFDEWLFARPFFWEDVFSMAVLALHTAYVVMVLGNWGTAQEQMYVALAAYATYLINAGQFLWKLRMARLQGQQSVVVAA